MGTLFAVTALVAALFGTGTTPPPAPLVELHAWAARYPHAKTGLLAPPEAGEEREERLGVIALGAWRAAANRGVSVRTRGYPLWGKVSPQAAVTLALLVLTAEESGAWDPRIHAGLVHPLPDWHQDHGRARCVGQIHPSRWYPPEVWRDLAGTDQDATDRCMAATLRLLEGHMKRCGVGYDEAGLAIGFAAYGRGNGCTASTAARWRVVRWLEGLKELAASRHR